VSRLNVVHPELHSCFSVLLLSERPDSVHLFGSSVMDTEAGVRLCPRWKQSQGREH